MSQAPYKMSVSDNPGLINYIDTETKCCHQKKSDLQGTSRQVFIRVYRLEIS
jgi:hypothetical protein